MRTEILHIHSLVKDNINFEYIASQADLANCHYREDKNVQEDSKKVFEVLKETAKNKPLNQIFHLARLWVEFDAPIANTEIKADKYQNLLEFLELSLGKSKLNKKQKRKINTFKITNETEYEILQQFICFYDFKNNFNNQIKDYPYKVFHANRVFVLFVDIKTIFDCKPIEIENGRFIYNNEQLEEFLKQNAVSNHEQQHIAERKPYLEFLLNMLIAHKSHVEDRAFIEHNQFINNKISALDKDLKALKKDLKALKKGPTKNKDAITDLERYIDSLEHYIKGLCRYSHFAETHTPFSLEGHINFITNALKKANVSSLSLSAKPPTKEDNGRNKPETKLTQAKEDESINLRFVFSLLLFFYCVVICNVLYLKAKAVNAAVTVFGFIGVFSLCWAVYERVRTTESEKFKGPEISEVGQPTTRSEPGITSTLKESS